MRCAASQTGEGFSPRIQTPHPALRATFSHKGRREKAQLRLLAARCARSFCEYLALEIRGRREDRVRAAPAVSCAMCIKNAAHEHTGLAETHRPSLRNGFTAYTISSW